MKLSIDRHRRRAVAVALPIAAGLLLAACSGGSSDSSGSTGAEPQSITFSYATANASENAFDSLAKAYMAAHPGVEIKTNPLALDAYPQTLTTQMQAGNGPDVMYINAGSGQAASVGQLSQAGLLLQLDPSITSSIPEAQTQGYDYNSQVYGVPLATTISGIIWNDKVATDNGVTLTPTTTSDDVVAECPKVKDGGKNIFGLAGSTSANNGILAVQIATNTVYGQNPNWNQDRADGKTTFADTQGWHQALQTIVDMNNAGCFQDGAAGAGFDALTNGSATGSIFGFFAPSGATKDIMDASNGGVTLTARGFPAPKGEQQYLAVTSNVGLAGNAKTQSPKLVEDFLKFAVSPEASKNFADAQGSIPIGKISADQLLPQYQPVADQLVNQQYRPFAADSWPNGQVYDALGTGVTGLLTGQLTVDDVLASMDSAWG